MQAQEKLGPVDMLVNCAGSSLSGKFEEVEVDRFKVGNRGCNRDTTLEYQTSLSYQSHSMTRLISAGAGIVFSKCIC